MTFDPRHEGKGTLHLSQSVELPPCENWHRYDDMMIAFHDYITGKRENPFTYEHDYAVQEVIDLAVGGVKILGKELQAL